MSSRVHILGICGTFMGGVALLARELGYQVSGSDANVYPPMSTMLRDAGIDIVDGYSLRASNPAPDLVVIGNALSRGNAAVEYVLDEGIPYISGPQWLGELLTNRWVMAISGTHGKTTTSSMLTWILECAGKEPGFLWEGTFGFEGSARLGSGPFVVEADEYDSAFFDKRSKFVHYRPKTLVINNLEFDHADIFEDLGAIQTQFHHLIRCVPSSGKIIAAEGEAIDNVLDRGLWTPMDEWVLVLNALGLLRVLQRVTVKSVFGHPMVKRRNRVVADRASQCGKCTLGRFGCSPCWSAARGGL